MKFVILSLAAVFLLSATEARAQTAAFTPAECAVTEFGTNILAGILSIPLAATNLGMGLGATFGSSRGIGIGAVITGGLGLIGAGTALYLIYPLSVVRCSAVATGVMGGIGVAMGGFAIGMGIYRIIASSRPKMAAIEPFMYPVFDQRQRTYSGAVGGLSINWELLTK